MTRGQTLQIKEQAYVELARAAGASSTRIMLRVTPRVNTYATKRCANT
jgi:ABC-type dipeptide/oligopeptide/nickel transport system permease subunit